MKKKFFNHFGKYFYWWIENPLKTYNKVKKYWVKPKLHIQFSNYYHSYWGKLLSIELCDLSWKDKYNSPRHEDDPRIEICLFNRFGIKFYWSYNNDNIADDIAYWESILDYLYYGFDTPERAVNNNVWEDGKGNKTDVRKFLK